MKIGVIVGSLRKDSYNKMLGQALMSVAPSSFTMEFIDIAGLPFFNQDEEANPPVAWVAFRNKVKEMDGFLFLTPEYNRSVAPALKNALDVGSRPYGQSVWNGKPCAVGSASIGGIGGFGANHHLRQSLVFLNMPCMQQPELYLGGVDKFFNDKGELINPDTKAFLTQFMQAFSQWVARNR